MFAWNSFIIFLFQYLKICFMSRFSQLWTFDPENRNCSVAYLVQRKYFYLVLAIRHLTQTSQNSGVSILVLKILHMSYARFTPINLKKKVNNQIIRICNISNLEIPSFLDFQTVVEGLRSAP